jgi:hypothetical protein
VVDQNQVAFSSSATADSNLPRDDLFYFWDFSFHPIINIGLKSILVFSIYTVVVYKFNFSEDVSSLINKIINRS